MAERESLPAALRPDEPQRERCPDDGRYGVKHHEVFKGVCYTCAGEEEARRERLAERGIFL